MGQVCTINLYKLMEFYSKMRLRNYIFGGEGMILNILVPLLLLAILIGLGFLLFKLVKVLKK